MTRLEQALHESIEEFDAALGADVPLEETWSDAARAASAAARSARAKGGNWRNAARGAYHKGKAGQKATVDSTVKAWGHSSKRASAKARHLTQHDDNPKDKLNPTAASSARRMPATKGQQRATAALANRGLSTVTRGGERGVTARTDTKAGARMWSAGGRGKAAAQNMKAVGGKYTKSAPSKPAYGERSASAVGGRATKPAATKPSYGKRSGGAVGGKYTKRKLTRGYQYVDH